MEKIFLEKIKIYFLTYNNKERKDHIKNEFEGNNIMK